MRLNIDTLPDLVVLTEGKREPGFIVTAPLTTYVVNSTADAIDDVPGNNICHTAANTCTLRAAIMEANHHIGPDAITLPAGTYQLTIGPSDNELAIGSNVNLGLHGITSTSYIDGKLRSNKFAIG